MTFRRWLLALVLTTLVLGGAFAGCAPDATAKETTYEADKGPDKVDVSAFPADVQSAYLTFATNCSKCHTLARPINTDMTAGQWNRYVSRMLNKKDSGIALADAKKIRKFLTFYQADKDKKRASGSK